jgi:DNA-binding XRE family transcriptional regulator
LNFGGWLAERRREAGMSQRQLAKRCALSPAYVAALERSTSDPPPLITCRNLARALDLDCEEVWQRSFAARLKRWLKREGYSAIPEAELLDLVKRIESASR